MLNTTIETEIVIIGAGIAGCIAAISLAQSHRVVLIDKLESPVDRIGECLAPAARRILKKLNLLEEFESSISINEWDHENGNLHIKNRGTQSYWGSSQVHIVDPLRNPDGFGWHLNRKAFEDFLRFSAAKRGVQCIWPAKLQESRFDDENWIIRTKKIDQNLQTESHTINAKFVIDASGRQSHFARTQGVVRNHFDKLIACWITMKNAELNSMSTISTSKLGWWYSAPLPNNKRIIAFQTDSDLIERATVKELDLFIESAKKNPEMERFLEKNTSEIQFHGTVAANSSKLNQVTGKQWVALGDAAVSFDPLSSQGMFNAMANAMQLTELLLALNLVKEPTESKNRVFYEIYSQQINQVWEHYMKHKNIFYNQEKRFKDEAFWSRRHVDEFNKNT
ncbi:NAD(P)/FAD-dependent oxidoreductase [Flavobacterium sp.]|uniref:NAD(P)/FAD-dependent oxidoreductase n=1 Tax=Flavobacterium sp. TaxID=239 RepID=UPI003C5303B7